MKNIERSSDEHAVLLALQTKPLKLTELRKMPDVLGLTRDLINKAIANLVASGHIEHDAVTRDRCYRLTKLGREGLAALEKGQEAVPSQDVYVGQIVPPRTINRMAGLHTTPMAGSGREGAEDFRKYPSRHGDYLHYRDGRVTKLQPDGAEVEVRHG